jgi:hypothetical protein
LFIPILLVFLLKLTYGKNTDRLIFSGTIWRFDVEVLEDKIEKLESDGYTTSPIHTHDGLVLLLRVN